MTNINSIPATNRGNCLPSKALPCIKHQTYIYYHFIKHHRDRSTICTPIIVPMNSNGRHFQQPHRQSTNHRAAAPDIASGTPVTSLSNDLLEHIFAQLDTKDDVAKTALVCRQWLTPARRALFGSLLIQDHDDLDEINDILFDENSTVRPQDIKGVHFLFTDDENIGHGSSQSKPFVGRQPHVTNTDVQAFLRDLPGVETLQADWVGTRSSPISPSNNRPRPIQQQGESLAPYTVPAQLPSFISDPQLVARLRNLALRGGAWPVEALLGAIGGQMKHLVSLSLEQIHESSNVINIPSHPPSFRLASLTLSRCTLSGSTLKWLVTSSKGSLKGLTLTSLRRRDKALGCLDFKEVFVEIGSSLRVLRARNFWEAMHPAEMIESGLGYCTELRTLVIWRDAVTSPGVVSTAFSSLRRRRSIDTWLLVHRLLPALLCISRLGPPHPFCSANPNPRARMQRGWGVERHEGRVLDPRDW
jgi:F-box domain